MRVLAIFMLCALALLNSCGGAKPDKTTVKIPGFSFNVLPNKLDRNGFIFAVHKKTGQHYPITMVKVPVETDLAYLKNNRVTAKSDINFLINALKFTKDSMKFTADPTFKKDVEVAVTFRDAVLDRTMILQANDEIDKAMTDIKRKLTTMPQSDYNYYMIVESIRAKKMDYHFERSASKTLKATINIKQILDANPKITIAKSDSSVLAFDGDQYINVFYKVLPLVQADVKAGEQTFRLRSDTLPYSSRSY